MGLKEWIIPQDKHFFNMLENESNNVNNGSIAFLDLLKNYDNVKQKQQNIKSPAPARHKKSPSQKL